ncbi:MAG: acyl-CoA thioesterase II [Hyphomonadaceae bacterium]|nr:MAG: acyl-CoA thioesterase II [Caulobacteraceae bacterium]MBT9446115.1 acyl-CoA thioesterase II [Hyphomonadaceae bacterium]TPW06022.1 MAG: acyl-CoA thioesterase II [Alphaproteobacteria bacterium]
MTAIQTLIDTLSLEPIEVNLFRGQTPADERERDRIFGGQVIAQALMAAYRTIEGRACHSLQCYFIRPGDPKAPVLYQVERSRDGRSFATRRVIAIQHGEQIFNLAASFHVHEEGYEHAAPMPEAPAPETAQTDQERFAPYVATMPAAFAESMARDRAIEVRRVDPNNPLKPEKKPPHQQVWFRAVADVGESVALNQCMMAYATDMSLLDTCARPHGVSWLTGVQMASLDHIIWFHRPSRAHQWHLYDQDSPSASGARGFNRGAIYLEDGTLVASVAQEGLIRPMRKT